MDKKHQKPLSSNTDPFLLDYQPSELQIASEFLSTWLPFLTRDLCRNCSHTLSDRILSLDPGSIKDNNHLQEAVSKVVEKFDHVVIDDNCDAHSLGSWKDEAEGNSTARMSWADMAQEDDEFGEEDEEDEESDRNGNYVSVVLSNSNLLDEGKAVSEKRTLPREQREYIRFMNVRRKKDFICFERMNGKLVNILEGLELHTGIFSAAEQKRIVKYVASLQEMGRKGQLKARTYSAPQKWMKGKGRQTIQFGCCYNYAVDREGNPPGILKNGQVDPIPDLFKVIIRRMVKWHVLPPSCVPDSCIVNIYEEGDCIPPHIDNHDFVRPFCTVSFLSECNILFGSNLRIVGPGEFDGSFSIPLPMGSVLVLNGNGADVAKHCVPAVPMKRISITFRRMDESKRPLDYVPEPDLQGIQPLAYEVEKEKKPREQSHRRNNHMNRHHDSEQSPRPNNHMNQHHDSEQSPRPNNHMNQHHDRRGGGRTGPRGSGPRGNRNDRFSGPRESPRGSQRSGNGNRWSRVNAGN